MKNESQSESPLIGERSAEEILKQACIKFFYYWWNEPGNNTEQGFDKWIKTDEGKQFLKAKEDSLPEATEWIPVDERMPEIDAPVLTYNQASPTDDPVVACRWITSRGKELWSETLNSEYNINRPTHWMELPEPPITLAHPR